MPVKSPWNLKRPERPEETRTFTEPAQRDADGNPYEITLTLRQPDVCELTAAASRAKELAARWITGGEEEGPEPCVGLDGQPVKMSPELCEILAGLEVMQVGPEEERFTVMDLIGVAVMLPNAWKEINVWAGKLSRTVETYTGNSQGAATAP